ncbi:MAG: glyoxalase [Geminicoccaceae bacterium]|nr:glyoxalase [Geminicoccaceae bacterium]
MSGIAAVRLVAADAAGLRRFYADAFGFVPAGDTPDGIVLRLGGQTVELIVFDPPGRPYPDGVASFDRRFQHFALVVTDMDASMGRLSTVPGWTPISRGGPQTLPEASGGVTAFKFRDPEGHPLELLAFPEGGLPERWRTPSGDGPFLGIDHTAIVVGDTAASLAFYARFGLAEAGHTLNQGPEQDRLDGADGVAVDVTRLEAAVAGPPALELLCYRGPAGPAAPPPSPRDAAATRTVLAEGNGTLRRDPDGHLVVA